MNEKYSDYIAYIKYDGTSVAEGFLDARRAAEALLGLDEGIRFFLIKDGVEGDFEIPVLIRKGTWEALIPNTLMGWALTGGGLAVSAYLTTAATQVAKNDFKDVSFGELVKKAAVRLQTVIKIRKHIKSASLNQSKVTFKDNGRVIAIHGDAGELEVAKENIDDYSAFPEKALSRLANNVTPDRSFSLGVVGERGVVEESISADEKVLFSQEEKDASEELFPEMQDGMQVALEGKLVRGNLHTNSLGLEYNGLMLTCKPERGEIEVFKPHLFTRCIVYAIVDRSSARQQGQKKPILLVQRIESKQGEEPKMQNLFRVSDDEQDE